MITLTLTPMQVQILQDMLLQSEDSCPFNPITENDAKEYENLVHSIMNIETD